MKIYASRSGFTLVELMLASALAGVVLTAFVAGFTRQRQVFVQKNLEQETQYNVRNALAFLERDLRLAGSGLVMGGKNVGPWFGRTDLDGIPKIVDGGSDADRLITAGISGSPVATLHRNESAGGTVIEIARTSDNAYAYWPRRGDVLLLGGVETARITGGIAIFGTIFLQISTDPVQDGVGLTLDYPSGAEVFQLNVVEYAIREEDGVPGLMREDSRYRYGTEADKRVAEGIEDLQLLRTDDRVAVRVTGRTREPVPGFTGEADGRIRYTLGSEIEIRMPEPILNIGIWPQDALISSP